MAKPFGSHAVWASCVSCLLLGAPSAHAGTFSATASAGPTGVGCFNADVVGGSGFSSTSVGPSSCAFIDPFGGSFSSVASASGSWVTGELSASTLAAGNPGAGGHGNSIDSTGTVMLTVEGLVTLPSGMTSAPITFGVTGLSGVVGGGPAASAGGFSSGNIITLNMAAGGSGGTSGTSVACLMDGLVSSECPNGGSGFGFGPGVLAPIILLVHDGDFLQLNVSIESTAFVSAFVAPMSANAAMTVDPLYLTLPDGVTFDSGIADFLSVAPTPPVPEPASLALFATGLGALVVVRRRKRETHDRPSI